MGEGKTLIIAEAGVNHNGDVEIAKKMIDSAKSFGAFIIKFQTGLPHNVISKYAPKATYQKNNTGDANESQLEMARKFSFKYEQSTLPNHLINFSSLRIKRTSRQHKH